MSDVIRGVTKEYREDLGEQDAEGYYDYAYRYWDYEFDVGDRTHRVGVYAGGQHDQVETMVTLDGPGPNPRVTVWSAQPHGRQWKRCWRRLTD